jgi:arsenate reductase
METLPRLRVLVLCTGNSARSQLAEALLRRLSEGQVEVHSAGTEQRPDVHPLARATLMRRYGLAGDELFPKHLDRFLGQRFDYVITVCDHAAEHCPVFPGPTKRLHWSLPDPAAVTGRAGDREAAFDRTASDLEGRLRTWLSDPEVAARIGSRSA